jgi:hypothetical protein
MLTALLRSGTVAFDPFLQAVISTYRRSDDITIGSRASIGQASRVDGGYIIDYRYGGMLGFKTPTGETKTFTSTSSIPDFGIISSIYGGFHNTSSLYNSTVSFDCDTGNCTWSVFVSAAVCSSCKDVSSELTSETRYGGENASNVPDATTIYRGEANYTIFSLPGISYQKLGWRFRGD